MFMHLLFPLFCAYPVLDLMSPFPVDSLTPRRKTWTAHKP